ncbi:DUF502 domain-containing protein [Sulfuriflexus sp.]|uniref:DUF502 domain-containing protein n=1 Tax=Sulfuriflexus sp. TaxID=2015443 RepID=UPI0028CCDB48|nr:DUF502 domain-containing protein [Sulfuriflexus sp.]MDT8404248.1 DUF502 domain-containing protein [Sulfuriflexus sp.]
MFRRYLIAGLLVWLPLGVTLLVFTLLVGLVEKLLDLMPAAYRPEALLGLEIPFLDVLLALVVMLTIVVLTGLLVANLFGRKLVTVWESLLGRIPLVRSIYQSVKQVAETVFSSTGKSFRKVLLIEYPRKGLYTLALQTGNSGGEIQARTGEEVTTVFVPTTPNPTSGFIILVPTKDVVELEMSVDEALKMVISLGLVEPKWPAEKLQKAPADIA